jgi:enamine deaminase RidA (YjgF/YER057c/UK114 family)
MKITRINPATLYNSVKYGFSHATLQENGRTLHLAGQVALDPTGAPVGGTDLGAQTRQALANLRAVLAAVGAEPADIVRLRTYVVDHTPDKLGIVLPELGAFFGGAVPPPNTFLGVAALAQPYYLIEIEATAAVR